MAQMLSKQDSPAKVLRAIRRHLQLTKRVAQPGAEAIAKRIGVPRDALAAAVEKKAKLSETADDSYDEWHISDSLLDRTVYSLKRKALDWDAEHPGERTLEALFQGRVASEVTNAPRHEQPDLVAQIVARAKSLPAAHPGQAVVADLGSKAEASRQAHRRWVDALQAVAAAGAEVELAKVAAVRAYRDNFIDIGRAVGEEVAELCFPELRRAQRDGGDEAGVALNPSEG